MNLTPHLRHKTLTTVAACLITLLSAAATADDTEIYFSGAASSTSAQPNVLFILDSSGSMTSTVPNSGGQNRLQVMQGAVAQVLTDVNDINAGLMRFTDWNTYTERGEGGPILYPVKDIDAKNGDTVSEPGGSTPSYSYLITDGDNDAEEELTGNTVDLTNAQLSIPYNPGGAAGSNTVQIKVLGNSGADTDDAEERNSNGSVNLGSSDLELIKQGSDTQTVGVRFRSVAVPPGATITNAYLDFWIDEYKTNATSLTIKGQDVDDAATFSSANSDISSRTTTTASVNWNPPVKNVGQKITSPAINTIVKEIVDRGGWSSGYDMVFIITGSGLRTVESRDGSSSKAPRLTIEYSTGAVAADDQVVGLHFPVIDIPQGATVTSAKLTFTAASDSSVPSDWTIQAHKSGSSAPPTAANADLSGRNKTAVSVPWAVPPWTSGTTYTTPELITVVQEVVNEASWCGGAGGSGLTFLITGPAGTGTRYAESVEGSSGDAPKLDITYTTSTTGCYNKPVTAQTSSSSDDAEQNNGTGSVSTGSWDLELGKDGSTSQTVGMRFQSLAIPQGATITSATIDFVAKATNSASSSLTIKGEDVDDASTFTTSNSSISSRTTTTASVAWSPDPWATIGESHTSPELKSIAQEIVNRGGWSSGKDMVFIITGTGTRNARSYNGDPNGAPRLRIAYQSTGTGFKTVRERLIELVNEIPASGYTPIVETLYEAGHYWRGDDVKFGLTRNNSSSKNRVSHPGSYCDGANDCNGADTAGYPSYGVFRQAGCTDANLNASACKNEEVKGSPKYISPFNTSLTCAKNYQVLLTDGQANSLETPTKTAVRTEFLGGAACATKRSNNTNYDDDESCGVDLTEAMFTQDQDSTLADNQVIATYTIGLNFCNSGYRGAKQVSGTSTTIVCCDDTKITADPSGGVGTCQGGASTQTAPGAMTFLYDMANKGGGFFNEAVNAGQLVSIFQAILTEVKKDPTSFAAPAITTNFFNRTRSRDRVYFGLFTPELNTAWDGNVKRFRLCVDETTVVGGVTCTSQQVTDNTVLDSSNTDAVDAVTNLFKNSSQSYWSSIADGNATTKGGTGARLSDYAQRVIYTDENNSGVASSGTILSATGFKLDNTNYDTSNLQTARDAICGGGTSTVGDATCNEKMLWVFGKDTEDKDADGVLNETRWSFSDVAHSSPAIVTYGFVDSNSNGVLDAGETLIDKLLVGTNEGGLRMVNPETGDEDWIFIPNFTLQDQDTLRANPETGHNYGLDMSPVLRVIDNDGDGIIEPGGTDNDKVYVYIGMRRGGNYLYAIDITPTSKLTNTSTKITPKFLWRIQGGTGDYTRMGDTWSKPVVATINTDNSGTTVAKKVLIMGGGYDNSLDNGFGTTTSNPNLGNAIYIVDADTGAKIVSISHKEDPPNGIPVGSGSGADIEVLGMNYSITSELLVFDSNFDGITDRLYAVDTGGNIWRVDLHSGIKTSGSNPEADTVVGRLANISTSGTATTERRFYERPAVALVIDNKYSDNTGSDNTEGKYSYVVVPSGYRAHPLDTAVEDRLYAFRDKVRYLMTDTSPKDNVADSASYPTITEANMIDITAQTGQKLDSTSGTHKSAYGWYLDFPDSGEKGISSVEILAGKVFFSTYVPSSTVSTNSCAANIGSSYSWGASLASGEAVIDWNLTGIKTHRAYIGSGLASNPLPLFTSKGVQIVAGLQQSIQPLSGAAVNLDSPTSWYVVE